MLDQCVDQDVLPLADVRAHPDGQVRVPPQESFVRHRPDCRLPYVALIQSTVERDETFERRRERMESLVAELRTRTGEIARGGGDKATERHRSRGKLTARERIDRLVDPGGAFLELNALAAWGLYEDQAPAAGVVTG